MATKKRRKRKKKKKINIQKRTLIIVAILVFVLVISSIIAIITVSNSAKHSDATARFANYDVVNGIDVSQHNGKIDWTKIAKHADFAIIRVGYRGYANGVLKTDTKAKYNMKNATKNGVAIGAYFYSQAINEKEAIEEAKAALKVVRGYDISMPIFIDFEYAFDDNGSVGRLYEAKLDKKKSTAIINAFCKTISDAGYKPGVYASSYIYKDVFDTKALNQNIMIWVADYNKKVTYHGDYDIWQYTETGTIDGNGSKHVDKNRWFIKK